MINQNFNSASAMVEKDTSLDYSLEKFSDMLNKASDLIIDRYKDLDNVNAFPGNTPEEIMSWFEESVPKEGIDIDELLEEVKVKVLDTATMNIGPYMYGYVVTGGTQVSILAEMFATAINQNVAKWHLAPVISIMEQKVVQWGAEFMGYDKNCGGLLVSGGSAANLVGLTVGRNLFLAKEEVRKKGMYGMRPLRVYASEEVHGCMDKSMELLGLGTENLIKISVNSNFTISIEALKKAIEKDKKNGFQPFCIVGNAGTVNTGAVDNLDTLADLAEENNMWFHVDGAYGGLAASLEKLKHLYKGMERADSIAVDFHKWLYQPFEGGCTLVKSWDKLKKAYFKEASYLASDERTDGRLDFNEHGFQLSRNAKALKIYMTFKAYGAEKIKDAIQRDIDHTKYIADIFDTSDDFELLNNPDLGAVCYRYLGLNKYSDEELDQINKKMIPELEKDGRVFVTGTIIDGRPVLRACLINHRMKKKNLDFLIQVLREIGVKVEKDL